MGESQVDSQAKKVASGARKNKPLLCQGKTIPSNNTPTRNKARGGNKDKNNKEPENSPGHREDPMVKDARTPLCGKVVSAGKGKEGGRERMEVGEGVGSPLQGVRLNDKFQEGGPQEQSLVLKGWGFAATGVFPDINKGLDSQLGPAKDLYMGKNALKCLIVSYCGKFCMSVTKQTNFLIVGNKPGKKMIEKAHSVKAILITYTALKAIIAGTFSS
jgi:hypothetical protein